MATNSPRRTPVMIAFAVAASVGLAYTTLARQGAATAPAADQPPRGDMGSMLVKGLKETPGCLGVESGKLDSGKHVIFAFFKDKQAAMAWYHHPMHLRMQDMAMPGRDKTRTPMAEVPDGVPVIAVASLMPSDKPVVDGSKIPFSQISIELYTPLTGGLNIGGGFSPDDFRALPTITKLPK